MKLSPNTEAQLSFWLRDMEQRAQSADAQAEELEAQATAMRTRAAKDRQTAIDLQALIDKRKVSELTVKIDAAEVLAAMRAALAPGAVLLSAEAVALFAQRNRMTTEEARTLLSEAGGEFSTAEPEASAPPVSYEHFWMKRAGIPSRFIEPWMVEHAGQVAFPWERMQDTARIGREPMPPTTERVAKAQTTA